MSNKVFIILFLISSHAFGQKLHISTGISSTFASVKEVGKGDQLEVVHSRKITPDINIIFETKKSNIFSFKTGVFFHPEYYKYYHYTSKTVGSDGNISGGKWNQVWYTDPYDERNLNLDFPMMLSANFSNEYFQYYFDLGIYLGYSFYSYDAPSQDCQFSKTDAGTVFSVGLGSRKWQFRAYALIGLKNIVEVNNNYQDVKAARAVTLGLNLTRIIQFKNGKKSTSE